MAATACAACTYEKARPPPPAIRPPPPFDLDDDCAVKPVPPPPPPPPPPRLLRSSAPSRHPGLCTESLGSESSGDVDLDDLINDDNVQDGPCERQQPRDGDDEPAARTCCRISERAFPPPISVIGAGGKPWLYLRPHREHGRLVLREVRIPSQELLQARREDGRFKLHFAPPKGQELEDAIEGKRTTNGTGV